ncbi:MAG: hypothetical protein ACHQT6_01110 [Candidatus Acidiferrales bacterium]
MFHRQRLQIQSVTAVIYTLLAAMFPPKEGDETDLRRYAHAVAMAMIGAQNFSQFDQIYDQIDITVLYLEGPKAFEESVRELLREAKKQRY